MIVGVRLSMKITNKSELNSVLKQCSAVLFDLDGTLFDLHANWSSIKQYILSHYQKSHRDPINPQLPFREIFQTIEERHNRDTAQFYLDYMRDQELISIQDQRLTPLWLMAQGLDKISKIVNSDCFFGIVSNNFHDSLMEILKVYNLTDRFRVVIGRDDVTRPKPDPEGIHRVLKTFDLSPERVLFTGDMTTDEQVAHTTNTHFIYADNFTLFMK